jgi:hypothetical protein
VRSNHYCEIRAAGKDRDDMSVQHKAEYGHLLQLLFTLTSNIMNILGSYSIASLLAGVLTISVCIVYRYLLPKPLHGIPYNQDAAKKLFGDVPEMMGYVLRTKRVFVRSTPPP